MDFSNFETELKGRVGETIKGWFPDFMKFKVLECANFVALGEGTGITENVRREDVIPLVVEEMNKISREKDVDIHLFRDIPYEQYETYLRILRPLGFYPFLGFPNTRMDIKWASMNDFMGELKQSTRKYYKKVLRTQKEFNLHVEFIKDYKKYSVEITALWEKTFAKAKEYAREILDADYFRSYAELLQENSELEVIRNDERIIAFSLNHITDDRYICMNWGVDYDYTNYKNARLYSAHMYYSIERAISLGKKYVEYGVSNYDPKMMIGVIPVPYVYFIKHYKDEKYSNVLAYFFSHGIKQPDNTSHRPFANRENSEIPLNSLALEIKKEREYSNSSDLFSKTGKNYRFNSIRLIGLYSFYPEFKSAQESSIIWGDREKNKTILLGTNSYLGAATHPKVVEASQKAAYEYGTGCSGSPFLNGTLDIHNELESELARFLDQEAVVLCSTGYQTNLAGITALCGHDDYIIMDERSHRSLFDSAKLSGATYITYRHNDMTHLEKILKRTKNKRKLVVTDSVFSMEGGIPDLKTLVELAEKYNARTYIDESHGIGVLGEKGRGVCELLGIEDKVDLIMGTFSKSFASIGGFIAGKAGVIDYIKHNAGPHAFSASLPPSAIATVRAVLKIIQNEPDIRKGILEKAQYMAENLQAMGYNARFLGTQIVPVILGDELLTMAAYKRFLEKGVYVNPVFAPAVPEKNVGFRTSYIANHKWEDLKTALRVFKDHRDDLIL